MYTVNYPKRKKYIKYDADYYMLYLHETKTVYCPESDSEHTDEAIAGYSYTGDQQDGGTLIKVKQPTYEDFVSGLIRKRYSADTIEAIQSNKIIALTHPNHERAEEFNAEWEEYQRYREESKKIISDLLNL